MLFEDLPKVMKLLNVNIAYDQKLFLKLALVVNACYKDAPDKARKLAGEVFLPALALLSEPNNLLSKEVWAILSKSDCTTRYHFYTHTLTHTFLQNVSLLQVMVDTQQEIKRYLRRNSIDNVKQSTRQIAKLSSGANALIIFDNMLKQARVYENMIGAVT